jgi:Nuclear pore protein 84 / 107
VAGHLNSVKALAERVPCNHLIRPEQIQSDDNGVDGILGQHALEYAQHSALWELFASFDRWEEFALQHMNAHHSRRDRLAEKQSKNEARTALSQFITRAKAMVLSDEGLNAVLDDIVRTEDPESYLALSRIRDLYVPEIILRMHEVFLWGGENIDPSYRSILHGELIV